MVPLQRHDYDSAGLDLSLESLLVLGTDYSFRVLKCKLPQSRKGVEDFVVNNGPPFNPMERSPEESVCFSRNGIRLFENRCEFAMLKES